jgi:hypothetical protein
MIFVVEVDAGGRHKVWNVNTVAGFISTAMHTLGKAAPSDPTIEDIIEAGRAINATYEVYVSPWHAAQAVKEGKFPPSISKMLEERVTRFEEVTKRDFSVVRP